MAVNERGGSHDIDGLFLSLLYNFKEIAKESIKKTKNQKFNSISKKNTLSETREWSQETSIITFSLKNFIWKSVITVSLDLYFVQHNDWESQFTAKKRGLDNELGSSPTFWDLWILGIRKATEISFYVSFLALATFISQMRSAGLEISSSLIWTAASEF